MRDLNRHKCMVRVRHVPNNYPLWFVQMMCALWNIDKCGVDQHTLYTRAMVFNLSNWIEAVKKKANIARHNCSRPAKKSHSKCMCANVSSNPDIRVLNFWCGRNSPFIRWICLAIQQQRWTHGSRLVAQYLSISCWRRPNVVRIFNLSN